MAIPEARLTIKDGALGIAPDTATGLQALIGASSSGTANVPTQYADQQTLRNDFGTGPLVEAACDVLAKAGGTVMVCKAPSSTAGAAGSVTATQTGTAILAPSGAALDAYNAKVVIVQGGANLAANVATFKYSLDGGLTYSPEIAVPTSGVYVIPNTSVTLTFTNGAGPTSFVAGDYFVFTTSSPAFTSGEAMTAVDAVLADPQVVTLIRIVGAPSSPANAAALASALDTKLQAAETTLFRYLFGIVECPSDTDANIKTAFASFTSTRLMVGAGYCNYTSVLSGASFSRNAAWPASARISRVPPSEDLGRVASGPVSGVTALTRDENKTPGLDQARFTTLRTLVGEPGFFITNGRIFSSPSSDFQYVQHRRVMDIASTTVRRGQLHYLNDTVRVDSTTGLILEVDARAIEARIERQLRDAITVPGYASNVSVLVDRTTNVLSLQKLVINYRVVPLGYLKAIEGTISFFNPALQPV